MIEALTTIGGVMIVAVPTAALYFVDRWWRRHREGNCYPDDYSQMDECDDWQPPEWVGQLWHFVLWEQELMADLPDWTDEPY